MEITYSNKQYAVFDNVLPDREFGFVWEFVQSEGYKSVHQLKWQKVFRLCDGNPFEGTTVFSTQPPDIDPARIKVFPTNTGMDFLVAVIQQNAVRFTEWVGEYKKDWEAFTAKAYLYPRGSALSWHYDQAGRTGSYTFYANPQWNVQWGGELLIAAESMVPILSEADKQKSASALDNSFENEKLLELGLGHYVFPKRNRLVIVAGGNLHRINPGRAGDDQARCSISGFFLQKAVKS